MNGILLVDKPTGMTSHDVVDRIRKAAKMRRIGHTGTLDPSATGLLILCLGTATRLSEFLIGMDKVYEGMMHLGVVTDTYDMDGNVLEENSLPPLDADRIQEVFDKYTGEIDQVPPMVSAVKVGGKRLYKLAREGKTVERETRRVTVKEFTLIRYSPPEVFFRVRCTRGTYARTLIHDVGQDLGCGAALDGLRRTWVGSHSVANANPLEAFQDPESVVKYLKPIEEALDMPAVVVKPATRRLIASGNAITHDDLMSAEALVNGWVQVKDPRGNLLALAQAQTLGKFAQIQPKRVFCTSK